MKTMVKKTILNNNGGFTLIELIMVIVILGILAVVALPKYADLQTEAAMAAADGVYGAAQGATAINFGTMLITPSNAPAGANTVIDSGADLLAALDGTPDGWAATTTTTIPGKGIRTTTNGVTYTVLITSDETTTGKAALAKSW